MMDEVMPASPVIVVHRNVRLAVLRNHSVALRHMRRFPVGAVVVRVADGAALSRRIPDAMLPRLFPGAFMGTPNEPGRETIA